MSTAPEDDPNVTRRQQEIDLLRKLRRPDFYPYRPSGVLLSDWIRFYVENYDLIKPFDENRLKRAGYELSVGSIHSIAGKTHEINDQPGRNEIRIEPFEVAIIQTRERVNMPDFVIGRWNIRVRLAYAGLLWVGGPQVDPGYQGFLCCPIYNLSDQTVTLHYGEELALIDFVTTTPPTPSTKSYPAPEKRSRLLFEDYSPNKLQSALATQADQKIKQIDLKVREVGARFDSYTQITFGILAILVAGVSFSLGKPKDLPITPGVILGAFAIVSSLLAWHYARWGFAVIQSSISGRGIREFPKVSGWRVVGYFVLFCSVFVAFYVGYIRPLNQRIDTLNQQIEQMKKPAPPAVPTPSPGK